MNTLLFVHFAISVLLIVVVLLQRTNKDGLAGIGGDTGGSVITARSANNFLTKITIILGIIFFANAIVLGNISSQPRKADISKKLILEEKDKENSLPIAH